MTQSGTPKMIGAGEKPKVDENIFGTRLPAVLVNHFNILAGANYIRIVFGEGFGTGSTSDTNWHTAIAMHPDDARALGKMLMELLAISEEKSESNAQPK